MGREERQKTIEHARENTKRKINTEIKNERETEGGKKPTANINAQRKDGDKK
jgi:hypothetical protein